MDLQTFAPQDPVKWQWLVGRNREMSPAILGVMAEVLMETGCNAYLVSRIEEVPEDQRGSVGHHQFIWIINPRTNQEIPIKYSGLHFYRPCE